MSQEMILDQMRTFCENCGPLIARIARFNKDQPTPISYYTADSAIVFDTGDKRLFFPRHTVINGEPYVEDYSIGDSQSESERIDESLEAVETVAQQWYEKFICIPLAEASGWELALQRLWCSTVFPITREDVTLVMDFIEMRGVSSLAAGNVESSIPGRLLHLSTDAPMFAQVELYSDTRIRPVVAVFSARDCAPVGCLEDYWRQAHLTVARAADKARLFLFPLFEPTPSPNSVPFSSTECTP